MTTDENIVGETSDPNGTRIVLLDRVWREKVVVDHPEMATLIDEVLDAVTAPDMWSSIRSGVIAPGTTCTTPDQASGCSWS